MKTRFPSLAALVASLAIATPWTASRSAVPESVEVSGGVVGIVRVTLPGGQSRALSLPVTQSAVFSGIVTAVDGNTLQIEGAAQAAAPFGPWESLPHVLRCIGGQSDGATFRIENHAADSISLAPGSLMPAVGDRIEVLPADTIGGLFGGPLDGIHAAADAGSADNIVVYDEGGWRTYFHDGTTWRLAGDADGDHASAALPPDRGIFFVRRGKSPLRLTVAGELSPSANAVVADAAATTFLANPFAATVRLHRLGLHKDPAWHSAPSAAEADLVHIYHARGWQSYYHDGRLWRTTDGNRVANPVVLRGSALVAERRGPQALATQPEPPYPLR